MVVKQVLILGQNCCHHHRAVTTNTECYGPYGLGVDQWVVKRVKARRLYPGELLAGPVGEVWSGIPIRVET